MLYIYKDRRLIFLCMLFFFIQINPNENESSCLISEWNFLWRGGILLQSGWILIYFRSHAFYLKSNSFQMCTWFMKYIFLIWFFLFLNIPEC